MVCRALHRNCFDIIGVIVAHSGSGERLTEDALTCFSWIHAELIEEESVL